MARGRNRQPAKCTNSSSKSSSDRPGRDRRFYGSGSQASSVPSSRPSPSFPDMGVPPLRFPHEMSDVGSEIGEGWGYRGEPLASVYEGDENDVEVGEDERTEVDWDRDDPGFGLGPQDQFREDRPRTPPPSPSPSEEEDYRPYESSTRYRSHQSDREPRPNSFPSRDWYGPSTSNFRDKLARDAYHYREHDLSPSRSDYTLPFDRMRSGYVDPARRKFVRSRPRSLGSYNEVSGTRTGKKGLLGGEREVEVAIFCSVM